MVSGGLRAAAFVCDVCWMRKLPILSRRTVLAGASLTLVSGLPSMAAGLVPTPAQTEGPFYPAGFPADIDNDLVQVRGQAAQAMGQVLLQSHEGIVERHYKVQVPDFDEAANARSVASAALALLTGAAPTTFGG